MDLEGKNVKLQAIGFDLGHTLTYRSGIPKSWREFYPAALAGVAGACHFEPDAAQLAEAETILCQYNTRLHPRTVEVTADTIITEILHAWGVSAGNLTPLVDAFFGFYTGNAGMLYADALPALKEIRARHLPIGILSDTAYGMPVRFYAPDLALLDGQIDVVLTSVDVGFRKPSPVGFLQLAKQLGVDPAAMAYIGDEEKDIIGAQAVGMLAIYLNRTGSPKSCGADYTIATLGELAVVLALECG
jgi:putative hydrolase of the HAD superfamily